MGGDVAAEATTDEVHALQLLRIEEALERAAERLHAVEGWRLAGDDVVSFGAQRAKLPEGSAGLEFSV